MYRVYFRRTRQGAVYFVAQDDLELDMITTRLRQMELRYRVKRI